jgi:competence protein ComEC
MQVEHRIRTTPFLSITLAFIAGIVCSEMLPMYEFPFLPIIISLIIFCAGLIYFVFFMPGRYRIVLRGVTSLMIILLFFLIAFILHNRRVKLHSIDDLPSSDSIMGWVGQIVADPVETGARMRYEVAVRSLSVLNRKGQEDVVIQGELAPKVFWYIDSLAEVDRPKLSDWIISASRLLKVDRSKNPTRFDYRLWLKRKGILRVSYSAGNDWKLLHNIEPGVTWYARFYHAASYIHNRASDLLYHFLGHNKEGAIANAILLGEKDGLDRETKRAYSIGGVAHVLCVSGLHTGVVFVVIQTLLWPLARIKNGKVISTCLAILLIWFYAMITGLAPPVCRASWMLTMVSIGRLGRVKGNTLNSLACSALVLLIINPEWLFDAGFQLSYIAVVGILYFQPVFSSLIKAHHWLVIYIRDLITVSLAAQLATFPLIAYYFNQFPTYFLLTNLVVIPISFLAIVITMSVPFLGSIPYIGTAVAFCCVKVIWFMNSVPQWISMLPGASVDLGNIGMGLFLLMMLMVIGLIRWLGYGNRQGLFLSLGVFLIFLLEILFERWQVSNRIGIIVTNISKATLVGEITGSSTVWIGISGEEKRRDKIIDAANLFYDISSSRMESWFKKPGVHGIIDHNRVISGRRVVLVDTCWNDYSIRSSIRTDLVIISQSFILNEDSLHHLFPGAMIVVDNSNNYHAQYYWRGIARHDSLIWLTADKGAFVMPIKGDFPRW